MHTHIHTHLPTYLAAVWNLLCGNKLCFGYNKAPTVKDIYECMCVVYTPSALKYIGHT